VATRAMIYVSISAMVGCWPGSLLAADSAGAEAAEAKDLTAVIALHGLPCGQVISTAKQGENDYIATCKDGNRYRVKVNPEGRVVVEKQ